MFMYFLQGLVFARDSATINNFNDLLKNKNYYEVDLYISEKYFGKVSAPKKKIMNRAQQSVSTINDYKENECVIKTQFVYFLRNQDFYDAQLLFEVPLAEKSFTYNLKEYPAQIQVVCLNCDNNVNHDFKSLYFNNTIKNCTQGG